MTVGVADGVVEFGTLLADVLLAGVLMGAVAAGAVLAAGELLVPAVVVLLAGAVTADPAVLVDGMGDGLAGAALPTAPPPRVVPWPGLPWTMAECPRRVPAPDLGPPAPPDQYLYLR